MHFRTRLHELIESETLLWALVGGAFVLRTVGIFYGLPLTLIADEPPFILGALQMLQSHTVVPAAHPELFKSILYYPPYLSYLYLVPFAAIIGTTMATWQGPTEALAAYFLSDLSLFFIVARLLSVAMGTASVFLIYKVAQSLFMSRIAAVSAAFLLATSLLHIALSMSGRHWLPVSFIFVFVLYILTREHIEKNKRIFFSCLTVGVGIGISTISVVALLLILLWVVYVSNIRWQSLVRGRWTWLSIGTLALLAPLPTLLYTNSNNYLFGALFTTNKTLLNFLLSPLTALSTVAYTEPVLIGLFLTGLTLLFLKRRELGLWLGLFFMGYVTLFYFLTHIEPRFLLPLVPLYALAGGYAVQWCTQGSIGRACISVLLCMPLITSLHLSQLVLQNDTRAQARAWALQSLTQQDKVIVYADLMRLPASTQSVAELRTLQPTATRRIDEAEALIFHNTPHALNLYTLHNDAFFTILPAYAKQQGYTYLIYQPGMADPQQEEAFARIITHAQEVRRWEGFGDSFSTSKSTFWSPLPYFFANKSLGPTIVVYQLL